MRNFLFNRARSFRYASRGCVYIIRTQENAWIHSVATAIVILLSIWLHLSAHDWTMIILAIAFVWTCELFNTALETLVDLAMPMQHPLARISKDVGAAAVLIAAATSVLIGLLILGPPLWSKIASIL